MGVDVEISEKLLFMGTFTTFCTSMNFVIVFVSDIYVCLFLVT